MAEQRRDHLLLTDTSHDGDPVSEIGPRRLVRPEFVLAVPAFATRMVYLGTLTLLPPLLVERGVSPAFLGVLVGVYGYAAVFMGLLAGALADRFPPARLAAAGSALVSVAVGSLWLATVPLALGGARLLHGIAMGLFRPTVSTLVLQRVPAERRASAISINNVAYVAGAAAGPVTAGLLADRFGLSAGLLAGVVVALLAAGYLLVLGRHDRARRSGVSVVGGLRDLPSLFARRRLGRPLVYVLADMTILHLWLVFLPLYLVQVHGFALTAAGSLLSLEAMAYAVAQPWWGRILDRISPVAGIVASLMAHGLFVALLPLAGGNWIALAVLLALCGALNAGAYPGSVTMSAGRVDDSERGRAMGLLSSTSDVGQILGPLVGSVAFAVSGRLEGALTIAAGIGLIGVGVGWLVDRASP
jgi:DHA1 family multidrug resistance protein-like MFS transporter